MTQKASKTPHVPPCSRTCSRHPYPPVVPAGPHVVIRGAGIAAACLAEACERRALPFVLYDPAQNDGPFASGNPVALVEPRLTADTGPVGEFNILSFLYATRFYDRLQLRTKEPVWVQRGVEIHPSRAYKPARMAKIARLLSGENPDWFCDHSTHWLLPTAGAVRPAGILRACLPSPGANAPARTGVQTAGQTAGQTGSRAGTPASVTIHATGPCPVDGIFREAAASMIPGRGVLTTFSLNAQTDPAPYARCGDGYVIKAGNTVYSGATFERLKDITDRTWALTTPQDTAHNRNTANGLLNTTDADLTLIRDRASLRATTKDRWPIAGFFTSGTDCQAVCIGFGSRGFTHAPIVADQLICRLTGEPGPIPQSLWNRMSPFRFV